MISYQEHYTRFLGCKLSQDGKLIVCHSPLRDKIEGRRQPLIMSFMNRQQVVVSLSLDLRDKFSRLASTLPQAKRTPKQWFKIVDDFLFVRIRLYNIEHFLRMTVESKNFVEIKKRECVRPMALADKNLILSQGQLPKRGKKYQDHCWEQNIKSIKEGRSFGLIRGRQNLSRATVEPIECGGGNISVATNEKHRKKGYGKMVVSAAVNWCFDHDILPIYYVRSDNIASIALARSLGFKLKASEIIVNHWPGDADKR
ncbi:MAG: GNAT family N-acetyltransferase [Candidatus Edwardsbacteria bacterium]|nr:GNAT family N-acetyltransferase [Candidatus Edwardsbacteria bacterium]MBU1576970.1 GNAT family N-acetyltransferase [Candidatus Edwardsbacteria bacterium]MBU2462930.1 GNAT family N-acetyltransferase [Candidatus Edwardsbacteria bacterium]MBU2594629.1 GNAT family N-acetyltransferase [Candidatus Edwardsbacteria bacterium]